MLLMTHHTVYTASGDPYEALSHVVFSIGIDHQH